MGTGSTTIEVKILHQISRMIHKDLYDIFLYIHKSYNEIDMERTLDTMTYYCGGGGGGGGDKAYMAVLEGLKYRIRDKWVIWELL